MSIHRPIATFAVLGIAAGSLAGCGQAAAAGSSGPTGCGTSTPTVSAEATGSAKGAPDLLTVVVGVDNQASSATAALTENNASSAAAVAQLEHGGVLAKDVQTTGLTVQPQYSSTPPVITGYEVTDTVTAQIHDLAHAGNLIDSLAKAAGNSLRIDQIAFSRENSGGLAAAARSDAVTQAAQRAAAMAKAAGSTLGSLCSIQDVSASTTEPRSYFGNQSSAGALPAAVPLQPGQVNSQAQVKAVYRLG